MKHIFYILFGTLLSTFIYASQEYPFIEPLSVEHSSLKKTALITETQTLKKELLKEKHSLKQVLKS